MIRRTTWIILAVFIGLVAFAWFFQRSKTESAAKITPTAISEGLFDFQETDLSRVKISDASGKTVSFEKDAGGTWVLKEPSAPIDLEQAQPAFTQLVDLKILSTVENPSDLSAFGLSPQSYTIEVILENGRKWVIKVGDLNPTGSGYYIIKDQGKVVITGKFSMDTILKLLSEPPILSTPTLPPTTIITGTLPVESLPTITSQP